MLIVICNTIFKLFRSKLIMKFKHTSTFNKLAVLLIGGLSLVSLSVPYAMADSKAKVVATEAPADADFKKLDVNGDHKISLKEAVKDKALASNFDATDANKDGSISAEEYASYKAAIQAKILDSAAPSASAPSTAAPVN